MHWRLIGFIVSSDRGEEEEVGGGGKEGGRVSSGFRWTSFHATSSGWIKDPSSERSWWWLPYFPIGPPWATLTRLRPLDGVGEVNCGDISSSFLPTSQIWCNPCRIVHSVIHSHLRSGGSDGSDGSINNSDGGGGGDGGNSNNRDKSKGEGRFRDDMAVLSDVTMDTSILEMES